MASTENLLGEEREDALPLLPVQVDNATGQSFGQLRQKQRARQFNVVSDTDVTVEDSGYDIDDLESEYTTNFSNRQKRRTMLVFQDAFSLILDLLQFYALVAVISLRWPWPYDWVYPMRYIFLVNLDIWEFMKMNSPGVYGSAIDGFIESSLIGFDFRVYVLFWGIFILVAVLLFLGLYAFMNYRKRYNLFLQIARLQRAYIVMCQILAMPIGVSMAKLFHCNADFELDVHNDTPCAGAEHLAYIIPPLIIYACLFIALPVWMIKKIRLQIFSNRSERHEGFLQLKETEFAHGLDIIWAIKLYHLFSSFRLVWSYYRPIMFFFKLLLLASYAALLWYPMWQMVVFLIGITPIFFMFLIRHPFRVTSFSVYVLINFLCMIFLATMGLVQNASDTSSVFFQVEYLYSELLAISIFWLVFTVIWLVYVLLRYFGLLCKQIPLWPEMTSRDINKLSKETQKYMQALLKGRIILEHSLSTYPLLSPVHVLSKHIQIINAYCREAEFLGDPIHDTLWDLLDELIEAHSRLATVSLFADSVKPSIRETAKELMKLMPAFKKRLAQREYDFILVTPMKRRMLLKMFTLGVFVNGKTNKSNPVDQTDAVQKLYDPRQSVVLQQRKVEGDDGFYEDMYDAPDYMGPSSVRLKQQLAYHAKIMRKPILEEMSDEERVDDSDVDNSGEEMNWIREVPSRAESDVVSSINDRDADEISDMMADIPSRPASISSDRGSGHSRTGNKPRPSSSLSRRSLRSQGSGDAKRGTGQRDTSTSNHILEEDTQTAEDAV